MSKRKTRVLSSLRSTTRRINVRDMVAKCSLPTVKRIAHLATALLVSRRRNIGTNETDGFFCPARRRPAALLYVVQGAATTPGEKSRRFMFRYFCVVILGLFLGTTALAAVKDITNSSAYDIIPEESHDFFGNLDEQEARAAQDNEAFFARGRMAFLFGYYDLARELWVPLANDGYAKAQANLGWMYQTGKGMPKDLKKAIEWYLKAAKQDHVIAKNNLGVMYENGWGTKKNLKRAAYWYREAASTGYSYGQYNYGKMLLEGAGVDKNSKEATYWLGLAALQGVDDAKGLLINKPKWGTDQPRTPVAEAPPTVIPSKPPAALPAKQQQVKEVLREPWILNQAAKNYTLQLLSSKEEHVIINYLDNPALPDPTAYYKASVLGEAWYSVVYGAFPSFEAAQQQMRLLPPGVLRYKPWIRVFADVQRAIKTPVE